MRRVAVIAVLAATLLGGCGDDEPERPPVVLVAPTATDPGGNEQTTARLPPERRWFGFNDQAWLFTGGPQPQLDQGVTAERQLADLQAAGANSIRITISWYDVEPQPGVYDERLAAKVKALTDPLEAAGGRALLVLGVPPSWARAQKDTPTSTIVPNEDVLARYEAFAGYVARTWPRAAAIETWNEPNTRYAWRPRDPEPELFAQMHRRAARAIRGAGFEGKVILGGLLGTPVRTPNVMRPQEFLKRMFAAGLQASDYDAVGYHAYPVPRDGRVPRLDGGDFARAFDDLRLGLADTDPGARLWITETGYTTTGGWAVPEAVRALRLPALVNKLLSIPAVDALYVHTLYEPVQHPPSGIERGFGLIRAAGARPGSPTPSFCALAAQARSARPRTGC